MNQDFLKIKEQFEKIKNRGLIKSERKGTSGLGYTFEMLLGKKEDQECKPDFGTIEIKCKLGYTKTPITLFNCAPIRNGNFATRYILEKYGYYYKNKFIFSRTIFSNYTRNVNGYTFKLKIDYNSQRIYIKSYYNNIFLENVSYWEFKELEFKLKNKLSYLALVYAYPYKYDNVLFYKYVKMDLYKLKGFFEFLQLISTDKIHVLLYIKDGKSILGNPQLDIHGVAFRIKKDDLSKLFEKINI